MKPIKTEAMLRADVSDTSELLQLLSPMKSKGGLRRIIYAARYSLLGMKAAWIYEAAFRQEIVVGAVLLVIIPWLAPSLLYAVLMCVSVLLVWCVEMINSAIEALADAISTDSHPLLGRAKDMGSAAVFFSLLIAAAVWTAAFVAWLRS